jgi:hypothetical protein
MLILFLKQLLTGTTITLPFLGIRVLYSTISAFDPKINSFTGPIAYRIVLGTVMELVVVIVLLGFGVATRGVAKMESGEWKAVRTGSGEELRRVRREGVAYV